MIMTRVHKQTVFSAIYMLVLKILVKGFKTKQKTALLALPNIPHPTLELDRPQYIATVSRQVIHGDRPA